MSGDATAAVVVVDFLSQSAEALADLFLSLHGLLQSPAAFADLSPHELLVAAGDWAVFLLASAFGGSWSDGDATV